MAPLLGRKIILDLSLTKETLKWEPAIPIEKMVIDLANPNSNWQKIVTSLKDNEMS